MNEASSPFRAAPGSLESEVHLLRAVLDGTTDSVFVKDVAGRYLIINAAGARYLGRTTDEIIGRRDDELLPAEPARKIMADDRTVMEDGRTHSFEAELPIDGRPHVFLSTKTPYRDASGRVVGLIGISRDITERTEMERALRESEERLGRIVESAMDAIVSIDRHRVVRVFNAAAEEVFRCAAEEARGNSFDRFTTPALKQMLVRCQQAFDQKRVKKPYVWVPGGLAARRADGDQFPIEATISPVAMSREPLLTIILRDVNELARAEQELRNLKLQNLYLREQHRGGPGGDEMVGESTAIQKVYEAIEKVAPTDATVLVTGETGTGKELVARAIHTRSQRKDKILVKVNCAALPSGLVESELFGHEKGAFTGAILRKIGRFETADGGTLLLDEIGDLPLELQAKLLRVLQEGEFERVGGVQTLRADVRVIAATNRDLTQLVEAQKYRADLFYRLNVFPIRLPPLRERSEDIPRLVRHFTLRYTTTMGKRIEHISEETLTALQSYHWPGNVRELENVIERAVIVSDSTTLTLAEWPPSPARPGAAHGLATLEDLQRQHIIKALDLAKGRVAGKGGAADLLGLKPTTLESRMKKLGISRKP